MIVKIDCGIVRIEYIALTIRQSAKRHNHTLLQVHNHIINDRKLI